MKKTSISLFLLLFLILLSGCNSNDKTDTIKNGTYVMEDKEAEAPTLPFITISDDEISFVYDLLSSYLPYGTYTINDDILTMTTDDNKYTYVFQLDGDNLIFQKNESSSTNLIDDRLGAEVTDQARFHRKEN